MAAGGVECNLIIVYILSICISVSTVSIEYSEVQSVAWYATTLSTFT